MHEEHIIPSPKSTINSYRSFGYNLQTAIADIIDNSISAKAKNIYIDYLWNGKDSYITILDDGAGMCVEELRLAMTPGSKDPEEERAVDDLGRFGMGLKSASFSQCKSLTVITKKLGYSCIYRCWDIDYINQTNQWLLLNKVSDESFINKVDEMSNGTMVLWEKLDRIVGDASPDDEIIKNDFYKHMLEVKEHISLVFHRFIESKKIVIYFKNEAIKPTNPFLFNLGPRLLANETIDNVEIQSYLMPHMSRIGKEYETTGGAEGWFNNQGFYVYRGDRLLVWATWLGLDLKKKDHFKLARISVSITNENDFDWSLDIKKSKATPPLKLRKHLKRIAHYAAKESAKVYLHRAGHARYVDPTKRELLWREYKDEQDIMRYKINRNHPAIQLLKESSDASIFNNAINLLEENVPIALIVKNQNDDPSLHEREKTNNYPSEAIIEMAKNTYNFLVNKGIPTEIAKDNVAYSEPFVNYTQIRGLL